VKPMNARLNDESGVVAVMVAILLVVLIGSSALAIDLGHLRTERRDLVGAADAVALGVAKALSDDAVDGTCNLAAASGVGYQLLAADRPDVADFTTFQVEFESGGTPVSLLTSAAPAASAACETVGRVYVDIDDDARLFFATIFGKATAAVNAETTTQFGYAAPSHLPLALCANGPEVQAAVTAFEAGASRYPPEDGVPPVLALRFPMNSNLGVGNACGVTPGNLGWISCSGATSADNVPAQTQDLVDWVNDGCPDIVVNAPASPTPLNNGDQLAAAAPPPDPNECGTTPYAAGWCDVRTGNVATAEAAVVALRGERSILLYDYAHCSPSNQPLTFVDCSGAANSANVKYRLDGFTTIDILGACPKGNALSYDPCISPLGPGGSGFTLFVVFKAFSSVAGSTGSNPGTAGATRHVELCGTERAFTCSYVSP